LIRNLVNAVVWGFGARLGSEAAKTTLSVSEATLADMEKESERRQRERDTVAHAARQERTDRERRARQELNRLKKERVKARYSGWW